MQNEKEYLINEIQQYCRINSPSRSPSPYKRKDKFFQELNQRSKSECNNQRRRNKKIVVQDQNLRNQYFQNILSLPYNDPRPTQLLVQLFLKINLFQQYINYFAGNDYHFDEESTSEIRIRNIISYSNILLQYGLQIVQNLTYFSHYKKYDAHLNIDCLEKNNIGQQDPLQQNQGKKLEKDEEEQQTYVMMILINGQTVILNQNKENIKKQDKILCQQGNSLQKINLTNLMIDQDDFQQKIKEYYYQTQTPCQFIVIPINDYHSVLQRNIVRLQKIKMIEKQVQNKDEDLYKQFKFLQTIPIFRHFSDADIYDVMVNMILERLCHGQCLFRQGDPIKGIYIIYQGEFQIMKKQERLNQVLQFEALQVVKDVNKFIPNMDQSLVVSVIRSGEILGFEEIIQKQQCREYTAEALSINTFYFEKKFNKLINPNEYNELIKLTEEKVNYRQQFKDKQEYLGYNLLEDIQNSSLGYQIFSKIKEDLDNSNLNKLQKKQQISENNNQLDNNSNNIDKNRIYRKRLNHDSFNILEKSLSPLQKTLPQLGRFVNNQSNLYSTQMQQQMKASEVTENQIEVQFIKRDTASRQKHRNLIKATPVKEKFQQNSQILSTQQQNTWNITSHHSTNRQKKTIDFLRESRCLTTQGDEIDSFLAQPNLQLKNPSLTSYKQKWNLNRRNKSQLSQYSQNDISKRLDGEYSHVLSTPINMNTTMNSQIFQTDDYDKMFVVIKNKDQERVRKQLSNFNYGVVRAVELENIESGVPTQTVIQTQPNEQIEQFEFTSQLDDLKPIVQKRKEILEKIQKTIQQQTKQTQLGIQLHDQLNVPKYMQVKQQRLQEASNSQSPKKERYINKQSENTFVHEKSVLMKFLKDKQQHEVSVICQNVETVPVFQHKKYSVQIQSNNNPQQYDYDKNEKNSRLLSQGASPHNQKPLSRQNPKLQYFQTKKVDENIRIVSRGGKSIKYRDNRSPTKILQIQ